MRLRAVLSIVEICSSVAAIDGIRIFSSCKWSLICHTTGLSCIRLSWQPSAPWFSDAVSECKGLRVAAAVGQPSEVVVAPAEVCSSSLKWIKHHCTAPAVFRAECGSESLTAARADNQTAQIESAKSQPASRGGTLHFGLLIQDLPCLQHYSWHCPIAGCWQRVSSKFVILLTCRGWGQPCMWLHGVANCKQPQHAACKALLGEEMAAACWTHACGSDALQVAAKKDSQGSKHCCAACATAVMSFILHWDVAGCSQLLSHPPQQSLVILAASM
jgi:hypothetical protein